MGHTQEVSGESATPFREKIRREIENSNTTDIAALSKRLSPIIRGRYKYFGKHCPEEAFRKGLNYANLNGNRHFRRRGCYVDTAGKNEKKIAEYVRNQLQEDIANDRIRLKEYIDPLTGEKVGK